MQPRLVDGYCCLVYSYMPARMEMVAGTRLAFQLRNTTEGSSPVMQLKLCVGLAYCYFHLLSK